MTLVILIVLELLLLAYIISRILRAQVAPNPVLRAATLTSIALFVGMLSVTGPIEVVLSGPGSATIGAPTLLKHLSILGCAAGVLLMALAQREHDDPKAERAVWFCFAAAGVPVIVLHVIAGGGSQMTSVGYVEWSHSQPVLLAAMLIVYIGGLIASLGFFAVIWPLRLGTAAGRGLAIMAVGAALLAAWCFVRLAYLWSAASITSPPPSDAEFLVTQLLSVVGMLLLTLGLLWSTVEADLTAWRHWRRFRQLNARVIMVLPEIQRTSDRRLGFDSWVFDRAIEVLDGLHHFERVAGSESGFPKAPRNVSDGEITAEVARVAANWTGPVTAIEERDRDDHDS